MKKPTDPLAVLPPVPVEIHVAEQTVALTPLVLGELPAFAKAIQPFTADLAIEPDWLRLLGSHGDAMIEAMATGQPYQTRLDPPPADSRCCHPPR